MVDSKESFKYGFSTQQLVDANRRKAEENSNTSSSVPSSSQKPNSLWRPSQTPQTRYAPLVSENPRELEGMNAYELQGSRPDPVELPAKTYSHVGTSLVGSVGGGLSTHTQQYIAEAHPLMDTGGITSRSDATGASPTSPTGPYCQLLC
nr:uncharacterized protein CI109_003580 [Kwoniella shandongensis]KAA5527927.1 hypothetical protein CI109_003580 [Kwoniella shandongensis]